MHIRPARDRMLRGTDRRTPLLRGLAFADHVRLLVFPSVASYVGGDVVAGVMGSGVHKDQRLTLFIDLGTNAADIDAARQLFSVKDKIIQRKIAMCHDEIVRNRQQCDHSIPNLLWAETYPLLVKIIAIDKASFQSLAGESKPEFQTAVKRAICNWDLMECTQEGGKCIDYLAMEFGGKVQHLIGCLTGNSCHDQPRIVVLVCRANHFGRRYSANQPT